MGGESNLNMYVQEEFLGTPFWTYSTLFEVSAAGLGEDGMCVCLSEACTLQRCRAARIVASASAESPRAGCPTCSRASQTELIVVAIPYSIRRASQM